MTKNKLTIIFLIVLACLLIVTGWLGYQQQKSLAETTQLKTDLGQTRSELSTVIQARDKLQEDLGQMTRERNDLVGRIDVANATINKLESQLDDQTTKAADLQAAIAQLKNKLKDKAEETVNSKLLGIVFTTGWNEGDKVPKNDLKEISINEKTLYVFCKWRLSLKDHTYAFKIFDESKEIVTERQFDLKPTEPVWNTWAWYYINKYIDKPGLWTVEIYLDGHKVGEKSINVLPEVKTIPTDNDPLPVESQLSAATLQDHKKNSLTKQQILSVANAETVSHGGLPLEEYSVYYDTNNEKWEKVLSSLREESPDYAVRFEVLKDHDYQAVLYDVDKYVLGGVLWVFVDRNTGKVITVYGEK